MAWGGFLNKEGSRYYRTLRDAEKIVEFLDKLKNDVSDEEKEKLEGAIDVITDYINKLAENNSDDD